MFSTDLIDVSDVIDTVVYETGVTGIVVAAVIESSIMTC